MSCALAAGVQLAAGQPTAPAMQWQRTLGGTANDRLYCEVQTADGGHLLGGYSVSGADGNKRSTNFGTVGANGDFWVVRIDVHGNKLWDRSYGGTGDDQLWSMEQTLDGGFILGGFSNSAVNGNKTAAGYGAKDYWIVKIDAQGSPSWDACFGGSGDDILYAVHQTSDGGYVLGGWSASGMDGNKSGTNYGLGDFWVVRLGTNGAKLWDRTYGGSGDDGIYSLLEVPAQGFILAGSSTSPADGTKSSGNFGGYDFWVVFIDPAGKQVWDYSYGGSLDDGVDNVRVLQTTDGGYLVGGDSASGASGNKTSPNHGYPDYWIVRLNSSGQVLWDRSFGGDGTDELTAMCRTSDGAFLLAGLSDSGATGNKTSPNYGQSDMWLVKVDAQGTALWDACYGGAGSDAQWTAAICLDRDGSLLLGCDSNSGVTGNKTALNIGRSDFWIVKLQSPVPVLRVAPDINLAQSGFRFYLSGQSNRVYVIERAADLHNASWIPLSTNQLTATEMEIQDPGASAQGTGFYRARQWP